MTPSQNRIPSTLPTSTAECAAAATHESPQTDPLAQRAIALNAPSSTPPGGNTPPRRPLRVLLIGSRSDILATIKNLHRRGFAAAGEWSEAIACPNADDAAQLLTQRHPDDQISILTKYLA